MYTNTTATVDEDDDMFVYIFSCICLIVFRVNFYARATITDAHHGTHGTQSTKRRFGEISMARCTSDTHKRDDDNDDNNDNDENVHNDGNENVHNDGNENAHATRMAITDQLNGYAAAKRRVDYFEQQQQQQPQSQCSVHISS